MIIYELKKIFKKKEKKIIIFCFFVYVISDFMLLQEDYWASWFTSYLFDAKIFILLLTIIFSDMFSSENELGMYDIIRTSKKGVVKLPCIKFAVSISIASTLTVVFMFVAVVLLGITKSVWNWNCNIVNNGLLSVFLQNPLIVTYKDLLIQVLVNTILAANISVGLCLILSKLLKSSVKAFLCMVVFNLFFSAGSYMKFLNIAASCMPVNIICNGFLNEINVTLFDVNVQVIYVVQLIYVLIFIGELYFIKNINEC